MKVTPSAEIVVISAFLVIENMHLDTKLDLSV